MEDKIYITVLGDTWDSISYKLFGDSKLYNTLLEKNPGYHGPGADRHGGLKPGHLLSPL